MLQNIKYLKDNIKDKIIKEDIYKMCKYITYNELLYYINILKDNTTNISMTNKLLSVTNWYKLVKSKQSTSSSTFSGPSQPTAVFISIGFKLPSLSYIKSEPINTVLIFSYLFLCI